VNMAKVCVDRQYLSHARWFRFCPTTICSISRSNRQ
jgi:hypothetical protein